MITSVLALVAFIATAEISVPPPAQCYTVDRVKKDIGRFMKNAVIRDFGGSEATAFIEGFNKTPPVSFLVADYVLVWELQPMPSVLTFTFVHGCATGQFRMPVTLYENLKGTI